MLYANRVVVVVAHKVELVCRMPKLSLVCFIPIYQIVWAVCFESDPRESSVNGSHG